MNSWKICRCTCSRRRPLRSQTRHVRWRNICRWQDHNETWKRDFWRWRWWKWLRRVQAPWRRSRRSRAQSSKWEIDRSCCDMGCRRCARRTSPRRARFSSRRREPPWVSSQHHPTFPLGIASPSFRQCSNVHHCQWVLTAPSVGVLRVCSTTHMLRNDSDMFIKKSQSRHNEMQWDDNVTVVRSQLTVGREVLHDRETGIFFNFVPRTWAKMELLGAGSYSRIQRKTKSRKKIEK